MRTAIITCVNAPYLFPKEGGDEIWAVNRAFQAPTNQQGIDRVYFSDSLAQKVEEANADGVDFIEDLNKLGCIVYCQKYYPELPNSRPIPIGDMITRFKVRYFTSTLAYMISHAIYERVDRIILHHVNSAISKFDYYQQKACNNFWCGVALGLGITVRSSSDCMLMKPDPWEPELYGYWRGPECKELYEEFAEALVNLAKRDIKYVRV